MENNGEKKILDVDLLFFDVENLNGRIYKKDSITNLGELNHKAEKKTLIGELGLPDNSDPFHEEIFAEVRLTHASHHTENIRVEENKLMGDVTILNTPAGNRLMDIINSEGKDAIVFRPRSTGRINAEGICEEIKVISFDAIAALDDSFQNVIDKFKNLGNVEQKND